MIGDGFCRYGNRNEIEIEEGSFGRGSLCFKVDVQHKECEDTCSMKRTCVGYSYGFDRYGYNVCYLLATDESCEGLSGFNITGQSFPGNYVAKSWKDLVTSANTYNSIPAKPENQPSTSERHVCVGKPSGKNVIIINGNFSR